MFGIIQAGLGAIGSIAQGVMGAQQASKAQKALDNYNRQALSNVAKGLSVSTRGADFAATQMDKTAASSIGALREGGVRGLLGGLGGVQEYMNKGAASVGANLDMQERERQKMIIEDSVRIRQMQEQRETAELAGLGNQKAVGQQNMMAGFGGLGKSVGQFAQPTSPVDRTWATSVGNVQSSGVQMGGFSNPLFASTNQVTSSGITPMGGFHNPLIG